MKTLSFFTPSGGQGQWLIFTVDEARRFRFLKNRLCLERSDGGERWRLCVCRFERRQFELCVLPMFGPDFYKRMKRARRDVQPEPLVKELGDFRKSYSSKSRFLRYQHEQAFLLGKGRPPLPKQPLMDVMDMPYSGNKLHPTQKPVTVLAQLIRSFTLPGELVLDSFAGSGSIVGEIRGPEARIFLDALNTGHRGSLTTIHANSAEDALRRLAQLYA